MHRKRTHVIDQTISLLRDFQWMAIRYYYANIHVKNLFLVAINYVMIYRRLLLFAVYILFNLYIGMCM